MDRQYNNQKKHARNMDRQYNYQKKDEHKNRNMVQNNENAA